jgi:hypothetical protein
MMKRVIVATVFVAIWCFLMVRFIGGPFQMSNVQWTVHPEGLILACQANGNIVASVSPDGEGGYIATQYSFAFTSSGVSEGHFATVEAAKRAAFDNRGYCTFWP